MKTSTLLALTIATTLSGCIVYDTPYGDGGHRGDRGSARPPPPPPGHADRDRDGVRDQHDRRPNDPQRY